MGNRRRKVDFHGILTVNQIQEVGQLLFNPKPHQELFQIGDIIVDVNDLSTLVAERYLTGFIIDGFFLKYSEEAQAVGSKAVYLPSLTQTSALAKQSKAKQSVKPFQTWSWTRLSRSRLYEWIIHNFSFHTQWCYSFWKHRWADFVLKHFQSFNYLILQLVVKLLVAYYWKRTQRKTWKKV